MKIEAPQARTSASTQSPLTLIVGIVLGLYWGVLFYSTHTPLPAGLLPGESDKLIHFAAYFLLAALLLCLRATRGLFSWTDIFVRWVIVAAYGAFDELTQPLAGRHADLHDWYADIIGAALGFVTMTAAAWSWRQFRRPSQADSLAGAAHSAATD